MVGQARDILDISPLTVSSAGKSCSSGGVALFPIILEPGQVNEGNTVNHLKSLLHRETAHYLPCMDYLEAIASSLQMSTFSSPSCRPTHTVKSGSPAESNDAAAGKAIQVDRVNEAWRRKICEWCFDVTDHFKLEREVVSVAMNYLDRMVARMMHQDQSIGSGEIQISKRQFQLVALTSLYIAMKLHGEVEEGQRLERCNLNVTVFVELSRGFFQAEAIEEMERNILFNLDWHLNPPTSLKFISLYMRLIPNWSGATYTDVTGPDENADPELCRPFKTVFKAIFDIAMYLTELSVCVSTLTFHSKNSIVAYAAILCAMEALEVTLPIPYDARLRFVNRMCEVTGMLPESKEVRCVRNLLCELCPSIRNRDVASLIMMGEQDDCGEFVKSSPTCVHQYVLEDQNDLVHRQNPP